MMGHCHRNGVRPFNAFCAIVDKCDRWSLERFITNICLTKPLTSWNRIKRGLRRDGMVFLPLLTTALSLVSTDPPGRPREDVQRKHRIPPHGRGDGYLVGVVVGVVE